MEQDKRTKLSSKKYGDFQKTARIKLDMLHFHVYFYVCT